MKRLLIYSVILAAVLLVPVERSDVGKLRPIQTVAVFHDGTQFVIETDTEDTGRGEALQQAFINLIETAPADIYLDTADFLLVDVTAETKIDELSGVLKDSVRLYRFTGDPDLQQASKYLSVHDGGIKMKNWKNGAVLPVLHCNGGQMILS